VPAGVASFLRSDNKDEFLALVNLSSQRVTGSVELPDAETYQPVKISGRAVPLDSLSSGFSLNGYEWIIYHRAVPK
jgi:hypothetical protein